MQTRECLLIYISGKEEANAPPKVWNCWMCVKCELFIEELNLQGPYHKDTSPLIY